MFAAHLAHFGKAPAELALSLRLRGHPEAHSCIDTKGSPMFNNTRKPDSVASTLNGDYSKPVAAPVTAQRPASYGGDANYSIINEWLTMKGDL
jgi:hypothetical protein